MKKLFFILICLFSITAFQGVFAQCDKVADDCRTELGHYISDGQYYRTQLIAGEEAYLKATMLEGFTYRFVGCTQNDEGGKLTYKMYDGNDNLVFDSAEAADSKYWDFKIGASDEYMIKATLSKGFGCVIFHLGYDGSGLNQLFSN